MRYVYMIFQTIVISVWNFIRHPIGKIKKLYNSIKRLILWFKNPVI